MTLLVFALAAGIFFSVGLVFGGIMFAVGTARHSIDVWEVTNSDVLTYWLTDPYEVEAALHVDGMLAVRRLRVLT